MRSSRPNIETQRFELRLELRRNGAAWTYIDDLDHRAIMAYRLDRADYSSREIARMLNVSPATAWRLIGRGERLPEHIRDGVDLIVPEPERKNRDWLSILRQAGVIDDHGNWLPLAPAVEGAPDSLLPREKEGPPAVPREDEGPAAAAIGAAVGDTGSGGETGPSPYPLPRERVPERTRRRGRCSNRKLRDPVKQ